MAKSPARLVLICGLPASGKSTLARQLALEVPAVRLDKDQWTTHLGLDVWDDEFRVRLERQLWALALELLARGQSVILEWGHWARAERDEKRLGARALGVGVELHHLDAPLEELIERARRRHASGEWTASPMTRAHFERWATIFQPPDEEELLLFDDPVVGVDVVTSPAHAGRSDHIAEGGAHRVVRHRVANRSRMEQQDIDAELSVPGARALLDSTSAAHLAYIGGDGAPRVVPVGFFWTGDEFVVSTATTAPKVAALSAHPEVALAIDAGDTPDQARSLSVRGRASVEIVDGVVEEYLAAARRTMDAAAAAEFEENVGRMYDQMARIAITPTWVRYYDFGAGRMPRFLQELAERNQP